MKDNLPHNFVLFFEELPSVITYSIMQALKLEGEKSVNRIRNKPQGDSWIDHTYNLRSSIRYAVIQNARIVIEDAYKGTSAGTRAGHNAIKDLAGEYADCVALVVVAGMDYAQYVEAVESKDVLASESLRLQQAFDEIKEAVESEMKKNIDKLEKKYSQ